MNPDTKQTSCSQIMDEFLQLDKMELMPFHLCAHLLTCKKCRSQVRYFTLAEKAAGRPLKAEIPSSADSVAAVMKQIDSGYSAGTVCPVSFSKWILAGICMVLAMLVFVISDFSLGFVRSLALWVYLLFGLCIAAYGTMFVGSNMDFFVKKIDATRL